MGTPMSQDDVLKPQPRPAVVSEKEPVGGMKGKTGKCQGKDGKGRGQNRRTDKDHGLARCLLFSSPAQTSEEKPKEEAFESLDFNSAFPLLITDEERQARAERKVRDDARREAARKAAREAALEAARRAQEKAERRRAEKMREEAERRGREQP